MKNESYIYNAEVLRVVDGDTIHVRIDHGFHIYSHQTIRLMGIDTPELRGEERGRGLEAKKFVEEKILGKRVVLFTHKDKQGKYGRYLAKVYYTENGVDVLLNTLLLDKGFAHEY